MFKLLVAKIRLLQPELRAEAALEIARRAHVFSTEQTEQHKLSFDEPKEHGEPLIDWDDGTLNPLAIDIVTLEQPPSITPGRFK